MLFIFEHHPAATPLFSVIKNRAAVWEMYIHAHINMYFLLLLELINGHNTNTENMTIEVLPPLQALDDVWTSKNTACVKFESDLLHLL